MSSNSKRSEKPPASIRTASYSIEKDRLLCHIYLDVSQNPIIGTNQSSKQFWSRIEEEYHQALPLHITNHRPQRSLETRMKTIMAAVSKLRGCVRQIENLNPSGASEQDILDKAKSLLAQDPAFQRGFKFDHVWPILKNIEKFTDTDTTHSPRNRKRADCNEASLEESNTSKSIGASSFCIDLNVDFENEELFLNDSGQPERPIGRKKEKMKKKQNEEMKEYFKSMKEENLQLKTVIEGNTRDIQETRSLLEKNYELQFIRAQNEKKKLELEERREENKILEKDVDSIKDPILREAIRAEQLRIYTKRARDQQSQGVSGSSNVIGFGSYFGGLGGSGDDLPDY